jgi:hypothetical protein
MRFLQTVITRKPLKRKHLSPGNRGGTPPGRNDSPALILLEKERRTLWVRLFFDDVISGV